jgi:hypothetical protein
LVELERLLEWYAADGSLVGQSVMLAAQLTESQALFGVPSNDPMYDCWPVGPAQAVRVSGMAGVSVDLARFAYFVTAHTFEGCHETS